MRFPARPIGVIFDMDGVIVDSYAPHRESWRMLAAELGRPFADAQFDHTFGRTSRDIIRMLFGNDRAEADVARLDQRKEQIYRDLIRGRVPAMPGAVELVAQLHEEDFRLAIGSSGPPENVALVLDEMKLRPLMQAVVTGADVKRGKPDPQVFTLAVERLGLPAGVCIVIEDAPVGIEAARRAGCLAVALTGTHRREAFGGADMIVESLRALTPVLLRDLCG